MILLAATNILTLSLSQSDIMLKYTTIEKSLQVQTMPQKKHGSHYSMHHYFLKWGSYCENSICVVHVELKGKHVELKKEMLN